MVYFVGQLAQTNASLKTFKVKALIIFLPMQLYPHPVVEDEKILAGDIKIKVALGNQKFTSVLAHFAFPSRDLFVTYSPLRSSIIPSPSAKDPNMFGKANPSNSVSSKIFKRPMGN